MSVTTGTFPGVRIVDMPDLGAVNDASSVVGERAGSGRFSASALRAYALADGPFLQLAGGIVSGTGKLHVRNEDWLTPLVAGPEDRSALYVLSDGMNAITGAADTLHGAGLPYPGAIGIQGVALNNLPGSSTTAAWGGYFEARQYPGVTSYTMGVEIDVANVSGVDATLSTPYLLTYPLSIGLNMQSGADVADDTPALVAHHASIAFWIGDNGARFQNGILFKSTALVGTDGTTPTQFGNAIGLAMGHKISWYLPSGGEGGVISSIQTSGTSVGFFFDNGQAYLRDEALGLPLVGALAGSPATGLTSLLLRVNNNAGANAVQVSLGAPDSGGTGYRALRVAN